MLFGTDIEYNGQRASDLGLFLGNIGNEGFSATNIGREKEIETHTYGRSPTHRIVNNKYSGVWEDEFQLFPDCDHINETISEAQYRAIESWLNVKTYAPLYIYRDYVRSPYYFNVVVSNIQPISDGSRIIGVSVSIQADSPFWWEDFDFEYNVSSNGLTVELENNSDDTYTDVLPLIIFNCTTAGSLIIQNNTNDITFEVDDIEASETMTFNNQTLVFTSTVEDKNFYELFNKRILRLKSGTNSLTITGDGTLTIAGRFARKVGM